jgi:hypothetical protein
MSYSEEILHGCVLPTSAPSSAQSLASAADMLVYNVGEQLILTRIMIQISTATVSSGNIVVSVYQRPTYGSTAGQVLIGTLVIPTGVAAGGIYYKNVESVKIPQGSQLAFACSTAAAGGGAAGAGFCMFKGFMSSEDPKNVSAMVASA